MNEIISLDQITTEIIVYKNQAAQSFIEIGKRLIKAKELVPHGEWGKYLAEKVSFSQSMANKLMKCAAELSNSEPATNLPVAKAFELLALPAEQREDFVKENDVDSMTKKQLREEIKRRKKAENDCKLAMVECDAYKRANDDTRQKLHETRDQIQQFIQRNEGLKVRIANAEQQNKQKDEAIAELQDTIENYKDMAADKAGYINELKKKIAELENPQEIATAVITKDTPQTLAKLDELKRQLAQAQEEMEAEKMVVNLNHIYVQIIKLGNEFCCTADGLRAQSNQKALHWLDKMRSAQQDFGKAMDEIISDCKAGENADA